MSGAPTTNVPFPTVGPNGFVSPSEGAILAGEQADINAAFGNKLNFTTQQGSPTNSTPQGQLASSQSAIIGDNFATLTYLFNQVDPAYASGRMQDAIARIYFLTRIPSSPTSVQVACTGLPSVQIPTGALLRGVDNNQYVCTQGGTIPSSGTITLPFASVTNGPVVCNIGNLSTADGAQIIQAVSGWDTTDNSSAGVLGINVESRSAFEARRTASVEANANGTPAAIRGVVLSVPGVLDAYVIDNASKVDTTIGGVLITASSVYVCVLGGSPQAVAQAIWTKKNTGCGYTGNTTETVLDTSPGYNPPLPAYSVTFETPTIVNFAVLVTIVNNGSAVPFNALTLVQNAIIAGFAGTDGGSRATIGSTVYASRYYMDVIALGSWASSIVSIQLGTTPDAQFTGAVSLTTLTVTSVAAGALAPGQLLLDALGNIASGTTVVSQLSGPTGGTGTYQVSISQTVGSESMTGTALGNDVTMNINQAPSVSTQNIALLVLSSAP